jgi:hypothetical protein
VQPSQQPHVAPADQDRDRPSRDTWGRGRRQAACTGGGGEWVDCSGTFFFNPMVAFCRCTALAELPSQSTVYLHTHTQGFTDVGSGHPGTSSNAFTSATFEVWIAEFQARMAAHLAAAAHSIGEKIAMDVICNTQRCAATFNPSCFLRLRHD